MNVLQHLTNDYTEIRLGKTYYIVLGPLTFSKYLCTFLKVLLIKMVIVWYVLLDVKQYNATLLLSGMQDVLLDEDILLIGLGFSIQSVLHSSF
jgi:hypothetical protein